MIVSVFSLSIAYSAFSQELTISGEAVVLKNELITVSGISYKSSTGSAYELYNAENTFYDFSVYISLPNSSSTITYTVEVLNTTDTTYYLLDLVENLYDNNYITYEIVDENDIVFLPDSSTTFDITFSFSTYSSSNTSLTAEFDVVFTDVKDYFYEQILIDNSVDENGSELDIIDSINFIVNKGTPSFSSTSSGDEGMYATADNYGTSYYFRGLISDNYVEFAGMLWRIIRIDGAGNIKLMLYNDDSYGTYYESIGTSSFNTNSSSTDSSDYNTSEIKTFVDEWYEDNLEGNYQNYLVQGSYCVDMENTNSGTSTIYYGAYDRLVSNNSPSLLCDSTTNGISEYKYYVGLISADELVFAGGKVSSFNYSTSYYLYTGVSYWTLSPTFYSSSGVVFYFGNEGWYGYNYVDTSYDGVFPTIYLSAYSEYESGDGSLLNPYKIIM